MTRRLRVPATVLLALTLVAAAFLVRLTQPDAEDRQAPFVTPAVFGQTVEGRDLTFTAQDAYLADRLTTASWTGKTEGAWLVIEATIGSKLGVATPYATATIGDLRYAASDRPDNAALGGSLDAGLPQSGAFVFELPRSVIESADARHVRVRFANAFEVRLDSAIDLVLDLTTLQHRDSVALQEPGVVLP